MAIIIEEHEIKDGKQVIRKFELNSLTLSFINENKEHETHFLVDFYNKSLNQVRFAIFMAIIFYSLFGIIDAALIPEFEHKFLALRYLLVLPMLFGALGFSFTKLYLRKIQFVSACVIVLSGFGLVGMIFLAPESFGNYYFPGIILVLIMNYGFFKQRFIWAAAAGVVISLVYIVGAFTFIKTPFLQAFINSFFTVATNLVGVYIARYIEIYARRDYFSNQLLKIERMKLKTLNARLEAKIKDKANQLGNLQKEIMEDRAKDSKETK